MIVTTAALCLAANLYFESRGEPIMGQYAVALVTMNRAGNDPDRVCLETFKRKQFSWTNSGVKRVGQGWKVPVPKEAHAWWVAQRVAKATLEGRMVDFTKGAKHYHATSVQPYWTVAMVRQRRVGNHVFYTQSS